MQAAALSVSLYNWHFIRLLRVIRRVLEIFLLLVATLIVKIDIVILVVQLLVAKCLLLLQFIILLKLLKILTVLHNNSIVVIVLVILIEELLLLAVAELLQDSLTALIFSETALSSALGLLVCAPWSRGALLLLLLVVVAIGTSMGHKIIIV